jgi:hypothetical protein
MLKNSSRVDSDRLDIVSHFFHQGIPVIAFRTDEVEVACVCLVRGYEDNLDGLQPRSSDSDRISLAKGMGNRYI